MKREVEVPLLNSYISYSANISPPVERLLVLQEIVDITFVGVVNVWCLQRAVETGKTPR